LKKITSALFVHWLTSAALAALLITPRLFRYSL